MTNTSVPRRSGRIHIGGLLVMSAALLAGCSTLPSSGPTGARVIHDARHVDPSFPYTLVPVKDIASLPPPPGLPVSTLTQIQPQPTDLLGPGDVLDITVYEAGVSLFGGSTLRSATTGGAVTFDPSSSAERLPAMRVDDAGYINVPFAGRIRAAGRTASQLASIIQADLRGMSQDPQVLVTIEQSLTNSVVVAGEVTKPGRMVLATNRESLVDAIALAGGYRGDSKDSVARIERGGDTFEVRLSDLLDVPQEDVQVAPGDRITVINRPQTFSVLGASNRNQEITFPRARVSLAEAVALAGGANAQEGDAASVFVFRYVLQPDGTQRPTVYWLNMMEPRAYLLAQRFVMRDRDVLYVGNARANQLTKFVQLLSQLFVPVATVRATVQ